jgi:two-component system NtrC family sensor kinase
MSEHIFSAHYLENISFDREIPLDELIQACEKKTLLKILSSILNAKFKISDQKNGTIYGDDSCLTHMSKDIVLELETIGFLHTESKDDNAILTAVQCISMQIRFAQKYLMASALHIEAIQEDYTSLCREHEQLLVSEAKYKNLCDTLDEQVKKQVQTIETTQRKLFESEKMASIGHLAAGVAHEINNPIGFINSNLNTAKTYVSDIQTIAEAINQQEDINSILQRCKEIDLDYVISDFKELLEDSIDGGRRVAEIVADLKLFSNIDSTEESSVDISNYINSTCNIARASIEKPITITFKAIELPIIKCRPGYISQVILALILNSADAAPENGLITIQSEYRNSRIYIAIEDNGPGISGDIINNVFDPFFTTKDVGKGKGMGLTSCRYIITVHKGDISIESDGKHGTKVIFWLPV